MAEMGKKTLGFWVLGIEGQIFQKVSTFLQDNCFVYILRKVVSKFAIND